MCEINNKIHAYICTHRLYRSIIYICYVATYNIHIYICTQPCVLPVRIVHTCIILYVCLCIYICSSCVCHMPLPMAIVRICPCTNCTTHHNNTQLTTHNTQHTPTTCGCAAACHFAWLIPVCRLVWRPGRWVFSVRQLGSSPRMEPCPLWDLFVKNQISYLYQKLR
jgi:hypothetical protein